MNCSDKVYKGPKGWFEIYNEMDYTFIVNSKNGKYKITFKDFFDIKNQIDFLMNQPIDFDNMNKTFEIDAPDLTIEKL